MRILLTSPVPGCSRLAISTLVSRRCVPSKTKSRVRGMPLKPRNNASVKQLMACSTCRIRWWPLYRASGLSLIFTQHRESKVSRPPLGLVATRAVFSLRQLLVPTRESSGRSKQFNLIPVETTIVDEEATALHAAATTTRTIGTVKIFATEENVVSGTATTRY